MLRVSSKLNRLNPVRSAVQYVLAERNAQGQLKPANIKNLDGESSGIFTQCKKRKCTCDYVNCSRNKPRNENGAYSRIQKNRPQKHRRKDHHSWEFKRYRRWTELWDDSSDCWWKEKRISLCQFHQKLVSVNFLFSMKWMRNFCNCQFCSFPRLL